LLLLENIKKIINCDDSNIDVEKIYLNYKEINKSIKDEEIDKDKNYYPRYNSNYH